VKTIDHLWRLTVIKWGGSSRKVTAISGDPKINEKRQKMMTRTDREQGKGSSDRKRMDESFY
jgi:hypothetical protein